MAKTRAEIQKAYRERKKQKEGEKYLAKERVRRMGYYVPSSQITLKENKKRNIINLQRVRKHRAKKKEALIAEQQSTGDTSGYDSFSQPSSPVNQAMIIKMNFLNPRRSSTRTRISRALGRAHKKISQLTTRNFILERKYKTLQRRVQRNRQKLLQSPKTPNSKTNRDIQLAGLSKSQGAKVRRQLLLGNALLSELKDAKSVLGRKKNVEKTLHSIISGKIIKKYRGLRWLANQTGINRNKLSKTGQKWTYVSKQTRNRVQSTYRNEVLTFFQRDDNSRLQPGKADSAIDEKGQRIQKRVCTDYLGNLYSKFISENPSITLSFATFCRMRPRHILTTCFISRSSCLCTKHQNMALLLKALRREGVSVSANPDTFIKRGLPDDEELSEKLPSVIGFGQWKRVEVVEKGRKKNVMRIVETEVDTPQFKALLNTQAEEFQGHVSRVKTQYNAVLKLKEQLPQHHMMVQMDFAQNYGCKSVEEIQSAYWNQTSVTLHPIVAYYKNDHELLHQSFVVVSDEMSHSAATVHAILQAVIPELKAIDPLLHVLHYWTDGPTSQYRNKQIFYSVANHKDMYGVDARWNYFEVGHGKGPCDGLGGTTKRMADEAVRSGRTVIQDAKTFMDWALGSSMKGVRFLYVTSEECQTQAVLLSKRNVRVLKGTFKVHTVAGLANSTVAVRDVSCYCNTCLEMGLCNTWKIESLDGSLAEKGPPAQLDEDSEAAVCAVGPAEVNTEPVQLNAQLDLSVGDYVSAVYQREWYIGKILDVDTQDDEIQITFLEKKKMLFQWPMRRDEIWVARKDIMCKIDEPLPTGKSRRMLKFNGNDRQLVLTSFEDWLVSQ